MWTATRKLTLAAGTAALALVALNAAAHHSAAQYDFSKQVTIVGKVKEFMVKNPHTSAVVEVTDAKGTRDITFEGHSASHFYRGGYTNDMVKAGDTIKLTIAPRKDGKDGGYITAFTVHGHTVSLGGVSRRERTGK
jgi:hypothetical protein